MTKTAFKAFPEFTKLTFAHRDLYESYTKEYPPIADASFVTMYQWWDYLGEASVSILNGNLVVSYVIHGDEDRSGLALVGNKKVDESLCILFEHLRSNGERVRLINVPEFVVHNIRYPELYHFESDRRDDEYIMSTAQFASIEGIPDYKRHKIKRFMREMTRSKVELGSLDLSSMRNQRLLLEVTESWPKQGLNALGKIENAVLRYSIDTAAALDMGSLCLFIDDEVQAFCLYHTTHDRKYMSIDHARVNYAIPGLYDYMVHAFSKHLHERGYEYANLNADMGIARLRIIKLALRPVNFFRKYAIEPMQ